jgi:hypothetical protein
LEDILERYRKSLGYVSDKIAQRGGNAVATAAQIQNASGSLRWRKTKSIRQYHRFNCSVALPFRRLVNGVSAPSWKFCNSEFLNKTGGLGGFPCFILMLLQPILIAQGPMLAGSAATM